MKQIDNWTLHRLKKLKADRDFLAEHHCEKSAAHRQREIERIKEKFELTDEFVRKI